MTLCSVTQSRVLLFSKISRSQQPNSDEVLPRNLSMAASINSWMQVARIRSTISHSPVEVVYHIVEKTGDIPLLNENLETLDALSAMQLLDSL